MTHAICSLAGQVKLGKVRWRGLRIPVGMPKGSLFNLLPLVNVGTGAPQPSGGPLRDGRYLIKKHGLNGGFIAVDEESSEDPISRPVFVLPGGTKAPIVCSRLPCDDFKL